MGCQGIQIISGEVVSPCLGFSFHQTLNGRNDVRMLPKFYSWFTALIMAWIPGNFIYSGVIFQSYLLFYLTHIRGLYIKYSMYNVHTPQKSDEEIPAHLPDVSILPSVVPQAVPCTPKANIRNSLYQFPGCTGMGQGSFQRMSICKLMTSEDH